MDADDEVAESLDISPEELNSAFTEGLRRSGTAFLDILEAAILEDDQLSDLNQILESLQLLKAFVGAGGLHSSHIALRELEDFGIASVDIRRIGLLAFAIENRSPESTNMTGTSAAGLAARSRKDSAELGEGSSILNEDILSGTRSDVEYESDFEAHEADLDASYGDGSDFSGSYESDANSFEEVGYGEEENVDAEYRTDGDPPEERLANKPSLERIRVPSAPQRRLAGSESAASMFPPESGAQEPVSARRSASASGNRRKPKTASWIRNREWVLGENIGSGSFGEVFQGMNNFGRLFAVKRLHIAGQRDVVDALANEIQLMRDYAHPNIVGYLGAEVDDKAGVVNIFQEWVPGGSLAHLLGRFGAFSDGVVANYTRQILMGLHFLHSNGIIHRDIKGGNILVDEVGNVKLADFGASTHVNKFDKTVETYALKGTPYFMAPEVLGESRYGRKGDIWAVGCTMIQMLTGQPPWKNRNVKGIIQLHLLVSSSKGPPEYAKDNVSEECQSCIASCFRHSAGDRPSAQELLQCEFLRQPDNLEDSDKLSRSGLENLRAVDEDGEDGSQEDSLEDSGVMTGLRMQMARVAQSTESLYKNPVPKTTPKPVSSVSRSSDTMAAVQQQIALRKLAKRAEDASRAKERGDIPESADIVNFDASVINVKKAAINPYGRGAKSKISSASALQSMKLTGKQQAPEVVVPKKAGPANMYVDKDLKRSGSKIPRPDRSMSGGGGISSARDEDITPALDDDSPLIGSASFPYGSTSAAAAAERGEEQGWVCLACSRVSLEPNYCQHCAVVRGSTGKKGLNAGITKR